MERAVHYDLKTTNHKDRNDTMKTLNIPQNSLLTIRRPRFTLILVALTLGLFVLASVSTAFGVVPAPDGGYPNLNTAEGDFALFRLTSGGSNTAIGFNALGDNTTGNVNTATGIQALVSNITGNNNTAYGGNALFGNTTGDFNTATGFQALESNTIGSNNTANGVRALTRSITGSNNTATGFQSLFSDTTGIDNTADGMNALFSNTTGFENMAIGFQSLFNNTTGNDNTAAGFEALFSNTIGIDNTAEGFEALFSNTTGNNNTATGAAALAGNTTGNNNTATGVNALISNITGIDNSAIGSQALFGNTTGNFNTATGFNVLVHNSTGNRNTADGVNALFGNTTGNNNTASGEAALFRNTTGGSNIGLGFNAGSNLTTGNNNIDIDNPGVAAEGNTIRVGMQGAQIRTFIPGISGVAVAGSTVVVNASGQVGIAASSERFKDEIKPMKKLSEALFALKPVTFRYKREIDPTRTLQFGLVAEDVEKVDPALVVRDQQGKAYTVRYDQVNAMLLNEFLKEHRKNEEQDKTIAELKSGMTALAAMVKEQESLIQKVSAQLATASRPHDGLEASKSGVRRIRGGGPAPQVVNNP